MKPGPNEEFIFCKWTFGNQGVQVNSECNRLDWLITKYFIKVNGNYDQWNQVYQDPEDLRYWKITYPMGEMQGGGPPMLIVVDLLPVISSKSQLRKKYLTKRNLLTEIDYLSFLILQQFQKLDLYKVHCIHLFLPMRERKEPDTWLIRDWLKANHPDIKIVFPQTDFDTLSMRSFADDDQLVLSTNKYGITEPVTGNEVHAKEIDLVLVPLLIFDRWGYRVGYGKGFYDRFCVQCRQDTRFIGISLFEPVDRIDDINEFDVQMHGCIAPDKYWYW